jgi:hypothetical protein
MGPVLYRCPTTGKNVQAWFDDDAPGDENLTLVSLQPACARIHHLTEWAKPLPMMAGLARLLGVLHDLITAFLVAFAAVLASALLTRFWEYF